MSGLPDDPEERVELLMMPSPTANTTRDEQVNSPTRLLAATWAYRISNIFGKGTTQRKIQESYSVQAKQLAACITGRKYLGGADRKRRLSRTDEGAPIVKETFDLISLNTIDQNINEQIFYKTLPPVSRQEVRQVSGG